MGESRVLITLNHTVEMTADSGVLTHRYQRWSFVTERPGDGEGPREVIEPCPHCQALVSVKLWSEASANRDRTRYRWAAAAGLAIVVVGVGLMVTGALDVGPAFVLLLVGGVGALVFFSLTGDVHEVRGGEAHAGDGGPAPVHMIESWRPVTQRAGGGR